MRLSLLALVFVISSTPATGADDPFTPTRLFRLCDSTDGFKKAMCIAYMRGVIDALGDVDMYCAGSHESMRLAFVHAMKTAPNELNEPSASLSVLYAMVTEGICRRVQVPKPY